MSLVQSEHTKAQTHWICAGMDAFYRRMIFCQGMAYQGRLLICRGWNRLILLRLNLTSLLIHAL